MSQIHEASPKPGQPSWMQWERLIKRFEAALRSSNRAVLDDYLPPNRTVRKTVLIELIHTELEHRLKAGEAARVEEYLSRYPGLKEDRVVVLDLITAEYQLRRRSEPRLTRTEYETRFPEYRIDWPFGGEGNDGSQASSPHPLICTYCFCSIPMPSAEPGSETVPQPESITCPKCGMVLPLSGSVSATGPLGIGTRLGKYELLETVGRGAFAVVYRARDVELERLVAVKVPRWGSLASPEDMERFLREARTAAQLRHPHIVAVYDAGQKGNTCYLVSEFVPGITLADQLLSRRLTFRQATELMTQVATALDYAHRQGIIHRDLKPSNIMLEASRTLDGIGIAKLMDFGLAKRDTGEVALTLHGYVLGTPAYMSPEQARGEGHRADGRSDLYSMGVILYELLTGELPFRGTARMLVRQILEDEPRPPRRISDSIPRDLETICLKCLQKEPAQRYATAAALAEDLHRFLAGEPVHARPVGTLGRSARWCRRKPLAAGLAAGLVIVFCSGLAGITWEWRQAVESSLHAKQNLQNLREAVDQYYTGVSENQLLQEAGLQPLRRELLEAARDYYARFVHEHQEDPALRADLAAALFRLASITRDLESPQKAVALFEQALAIQEQLVRESPKVDAYQYGLAQTLNSLGSLTLDFTKYEAAHRRSLAIFQELARRSPDTPAYCYGIFRNYNDLGVLYAAAGQVDKAEKAYQEAITTIQKLAHDEPSIAKYQDELIRGHRNLAHLYRHNGQLTKAESHYQAALDLSRRLVDGHPGVASFRNDLGSSYFNLGIVYLSAEGAAPAEASPALLAQARAAFEKGLIELRQVARAGPSITTYQHDLAGGLYLWGLLCQLSGQWADAEKAYTEALTLFEKIPPDYVPIVRQEANRDLTRLTYASFLRDIGRTDEALARYGRLIPSLEAVWRHEERNVQAKSLLCNAHIARAIAYCLNAHYAGALADWECAVAEDSGKSRHLWQFQSAWTRARMAGVRGTQAIHAIYAQATAEADALIQKGGLVAGRLYILAGTYSLASAAAARDEELSPAERAARTERYAARAVMLLTKARTAGFFLPAGRLALLREGAEFEPLRGRPDFQRLLAEDRDSTAVDGHEYAQTLIAQECVAAPRLTSDCELIGCAENLKDGLDREVGYAEGGPVEADVPGIGAQAKVVHEKAILLSHTAT